MLITRSTFSRASTWNGDRPCETMRSFSGEEEWFPSDDERVSPSKANPFRPRNAYCRSINLPKMVKSDIHDEVTCACNREDDRGGWGERALKVQRQVPGDLSWITYLTNLIVNNGEWESITIYQPWQKSDRPVVAEKWGNAHGAKGPSFSHVSNKIRRTA